MAGIANQEAGRERLKGERRGGEMGERQEVLVGMKGGGAVPRLLFLYSQRLVFLVSGV